jgi:glycosyltransferase involved in cell wall biosynthesis
VIVPVHGWAPYLGETLDAVLAEQPDDVVVVDDASPRPVALVPEHSAARVVRLERRRGLAGARAAGMAALDTELIALCDADDVWEPGSLELRTAALGDAAACFARALIVGPDNRPTGEHWPDPSLTLPGAYERNWACVSGALLARPALERAGGLDCDLPRAEDWDLWLRLLGAGERLTYEPRAVVRYRRRAGALSGDVAELARAQLEVHARHAGLVDLLVAERARRSDLRGLAAGLVRQRRYTDARAALHAAGERSLSLTLPGVRALRGRRDPYRR